MEGKNKNVTVTWRHRASGEWNRLCLTPRTLLLGGGLFMAALLVGVVAAGVALRLYGENASLNATAQELEAERRRLADRVQLVESEMEQARAGLARVREEEAKIRSWLGLERETADGADIPGEEAETSGGKGSLEDTQLEAVAPRDRATQAEALEDGPGDGTGLGDSAQALAQDLLELAAQVHERRRYWDSIPAISPVDGEHWISSAFGWRRSPFTGQREFHSGVDMAGRRGTAIVAGADGRVSRVVRDANLGRAITLDHGHGVETIYGHLDEVLVDKGERVTRGQLIGKMGSSGKRSTGSHLHYAVKVDGKYVNPWYYMLDRNRPGVEAVAFR